MSPNLRFLVVTTASLFYPWLEGKWTFPAFVVPWVKHGGGGVIVWGCFAGDTFGDYWSKLRAHLTTAFCSDMPCHRVCT